MNIKDRFKALFLGREIAAPAPAQDAVNKFLQAMNAYIAPGMPVWNDDNVAKYIEEGFIKNAPLFSVVDFVAKKASKVDYELCRDLGRGKIEVIYDHKVYDLIYSPNPDQSKTEVYEQIYGYYILTGNTYAYFMLPGVGKEADIPIRQYCLPSQWMEVLGGDGVNRSIDGYRLQTVGYEMNFTTNEVLHMKAAQFLFGSGQEKYGLSPIRASWRATQTSNSAYEYAKKSFDNMGPPGILFEKGQDMLKTVLTETQQKNLENKLRKMSGVKTANGLAVASGDFGYHHFGLSPVDMAVIDMMKFTMVDMLNALHLPGQLFNVETQQKYDNMRQARMMAYTDCILPLVERYCDDFTRSVLPRYPDLKNCYLKPVTKNIPELQADRKELMEWASKAWQLRPDEVREVLGYEATNEPEMQSIYIPSTLKPIEMAGLNEGILPTT